MNGICLFTYFADKKHRKHRINRTGGCSSGYTVTLDSTGSSYQPDTAGDYVEVCADDGKPIFRYNFILKYFMTHYEYHVKCINANVARLLKFGL